MNSERSGHEHTTCLCVSDGRSAWLIGWLTGLVTMVIVSSLLLQQSNSSIALILFFFFFPRSSRSACARQSSRRPPPPPSPAWRCQPSVLTPFSHTKLLFNTFTRSTWPTLCFSSFPQKKQVHQTETGHPQGKRNMSHPLRQMHRKHCPSHSHSRHEQI